MTIYHMINWFFAFSFFGYLLECVVLSYEYRQPVLNRGFGHGPFCIIYGFGALGAYGLLSPAANHLPLLYAASAAMATMMELVTAHMMIRLFGAFWWDYSHKPFNYKGMICLESTVAWGFLGILFFRFLDSLVHNLVAHIPEILEAKLAIMLAVCYLLDFAYCVRQRTAENDEDDSKSALGRLKVL